MKTTLLSRAGLFGLFLCAGFIARAQLPFQPLYDAPANAEEAQELNSIFALARAASARVEPGANASFQRRQIAIELNAELENFSASHTNSAWTPGVRLWLAHRAQLGSAYGQAMSYFSEVWTAAGSFTNVEGQQMAREASGGLAKLLVLTGRLAEFDRLELEARQIGRELVGSDARWAQEMRAWVQKHPGDAYKCGLYSLDQLGRLTQPGQFQPKERRAA